MFYCLIVLFITIKFIHSFVLTYSGPISVNFYKLKFHGSSILVASSRHLRQDAVRAGRVGEDVTGMLWGNCCRGIQA